MTPPDPPARCRVVCRRRLRAISPPLPPAAAAAVCRLLAARPRLFSPAVLAEPAWRDLPPVRPAA